MLKYAKLGAIVKQLCCNKHERTIHTVQLLQLEQYTINSMTMTTLSTQVQYILHCSLGSNNAAIFWYSIIHLLEISEKNKELHCNILEILCENFAVLFQNYNVIKNSMHFG